jgi:AAA+ ATPase superfamily predicted ATPase
MIARALQKKLEKRLDFKKAFLIFGPRQVGKTTLAKAFAESLQEEYTYFSGDSIVTRTLWSMSGIEALKQSFGHKKVVILDEAQNTTPEQMKMFLTRLGFGSKMVITGDVTQIDLPNAQKSGLKVVRDILKDIDDIAFLELTAEDVVRHRLIGDIVKAYESFDVNQHVLRPIRQ